MWLIATTSPQTFFLGSVLLTVIGAVPGTLAYKASRRDTEDRTKVAEGANAITGFDAFSRALQADNATLREEMAELRTHVERIPGLERHIDELEHKVTDLERENERLRAQR